MFADCDASALAGAAVSVPASTTVAPHSTAALLLMEFSQNGEGGSDPRVTRAVAASFRKSGCRKNVFDKI
ncbi:hypothetical protein GCM10010384_37350 [Streptomyces djakartensis]|uniref:Uncharacterized protein n=1 Tax=Streptomyces djakartensis TaxID=68193 RepID=A0ABQ2ZVI2_9ACTN|nr:hypothetical protein GCM10010384_37350 [Streptomyces djakartensis]